jgi:hypothetical protein
VALATAPHEVTTIAALARLVDHESVMSLIHPLITLIDHIDVGKRQVRLVHQSVKEFIARDWHLFPDPATSTVSDRKNMYQHIQSSEAFIREVCINYLLLDEIGSFHLFSEEQVAINELPQEFDLFEDTDLSGYDPCCTWEVWEENMIRYEPNERGFGQFFVYAASHWANHYSINHDGLYHYDSTIASTTMISTTGTSITTGSTTIPSFTTIASTTTILTSTAITAATSTKVYTTTELVNFYRNHAYRHDFYVYIFEDRIHRAHLSEGMVNFVFVRYDDTYNKYIVQKDDRIHVYHGILYKEVVNLLFVCQD